MTRTCTEQDWAELKRGNEVKIESVQEFMADRIRVVIFSENERM